MRRDGGEEFKLRVGVRETFGDVERPARERLVPCGQSDPRDLRLITGVAREKWRRIGELVVGEPLGGTAGVAGVVCGQRQDPCGVATNGWAVSVVHLQGDSRERGHLGPVPGAQCDFESRQHLPRGRHG